ncbi:manganese superoxide dismutase [Exidia glandulosa HHB12029]|uniref:Superoxide dismutase n=1 Tax=Exidia glandulosa HHB12029 TaxID=1314781 RepID=A0A165KGZ5_EXIGL|nr:manganese superoxide dismutase [Exidia glandulosa HHB12029]
MSDYTLPTLPYAYNALEPYISEEIMTIHHTKHHQAYINALKTAEASYAQAAAPKERIALQAAIKFNGGGHINHSLFWKNLAPANSDAAKLKAGPLQDAINRDFGSLDNLKAELNASSAAVQGSGWGWLVYNKKTGKTEILTLPNQDPVLPPYVPLIGIDVWEHAYYLQYKNVRPDYLKAIWNVINFEEAEKRLVEASKVC